MRRYQVLTASERKELMDDELKPSMPRAPRKPVKKDVLKSNYARAGVDYEILDTAKHIKVK